MPKMWKESYRLGVDHIDNQHIQLFHTTENLLEAIEQDRDGSYQSECIKAVVFLKDYVVKHFADEEAYQQSIEYEGYEEHKMLHMRFVRTILNYEKRMVESEFDMKVVRGFAGSLVAWLIHHVAGADQKIVGKAPARSIVMLATYLDNFAASFYEVLHTMLGLQTSDISKTLMPNRKFEGDLSVEINIDGDVKGSVTFVYSWEFARALIHSMLSWDPPKLDEIALSAMAEITNIVCGGVAVRLQSGGRKCDITPPKVLPLPHPVWENEGFALTTPYGDVQVLLALD